MSDEIETENKNLRLTLERVAFLLEGKHCKQGTRCFHEACHANREVFQFIQKAMKEPRPSDVLSDKKIIEKLRNQLYDIRKITDR